MSSVSSTSCFTAVLIVDSDDAMKSASRPRLGDVHRPASADRRTAAATASTTCWKFVLMLRASASISRRSASLVSSTAARHAGAQVGLRRHDLVERQPREALHDQAQAAVGQLEHLVDVRRGADRVQVVLRRLLDRRVALREHRDQLAVRDRIVDQADGASRGPRPAA